MKQEINFPGNQSVVEASEEVPNFVAIEGPDSVLDVDGLPWWQWRDQSEEWRNANNLPPLSSYTTGKKAVNSQEPSLAQK